MVARLLSLTITVQTPNSTATPTSHQRPRRAAVWASPRSIRHFLSDASSIGAMTDLIMDLFIHKKHHCLRLRDFLSIHENGIPIIVEIACRKPKRNRNGNFRELDVQYRLVKSRIIQPKPMEVLQTMYLSTSILLVALISSLLLQIVIMSART